MNIFAHNGHNHAAEAMQAVNTPIVIVGLLALGIATGVIVYVMKKKKK